MEVQKTKKRTGARFNIMDFLILLILLLCVFSLVARYTTVLDKIGITGRMEQYEVSFIVTGLRYTTPGSLQMDDQIYLQDENNTYMGTLLSRQNGSTDVLTITPSSEYRHSETGFLSVYYAENTLVDISGRILCEGRVSDDGYFLLGGNVYVAEGQTLPVCTDKVWFDLIVTDIARVEQPGIYAN